MMQRFAYVETFIATLAASGVRDIALAPGSRSTPLALWAAEHEGLKIWRHVDERSAGFFALGLAKASGRPAALICTSGTAAANFLPAVVEAHYSMVPLIVLTADRPHEARENASPQAIDQIKLYGGFVKWFAEMPPTDDGPELIAHARQQAARAVAEALQGPPGPVHLNFPFREPLVPEAITSKNPAAITSADPPAFRSDDSAVITSADSPAITSENSERGSAGSEPLDRHPPVSVAYGKVGIADDEADRLAERFLGFKRPLFVCGPLEGFEQHADGLQMREVLPLVAARLNAPILADPLSGLRTGGHDRSLIIDAYDALLRDPSFVAAHRADAIIRIGGISSSKALTTYLQTHEGEHIVIDPHRWRDPYLRATQMVRAEPLRVYRSVLAALQRQIDAAGERPSSQERQAWAASWRTANDRARRSIDQVFRAQPHFFEGRIFAELNALLPPDAALFVGNSMPVRDLDTFFPCTDRPIRLMANRGANGIDGVLSTALGAQAARGGPMALVIGDLSFLHDIGGLLAAKQHGLQLLIILVHNDGGGIFSFLPQADLPRHFETLFGAPHGLDFEPVARTFGATYHRAQDWNHFQSLVSQFIDAGGLTVIEVATSRHENVALHQQVWEAVKDGWRA